MLSAALHAPSGSFGVGCDVTRWHAKGVSRPPSCSRVRPLLRPALGGDRGMMTVTCDVASPSSSSMSSRVFTGSSSLGIFFFGRREPDGALGPSRSALHPGHLPTRRPVAPPRARGTSTRRASSSSSSSSSSPRGARGRRRGGGHRSGWPDGRGRERIRPAGDDEPEPEWAAPEWTDLASLDAEGRSPDLDSEGRRRRRRRRNRSSPGSSGDASLGAHHRDAPSTARDHWHEDAGRSASPRGGAASQRRDGPSGSGSGHRSGARGSGRGGREGVWRYASEGRQRAWEAATRTPLAEGESFRIVDVVKRDNSRSVGGKSRGNELATNKGWGLRIHNASDGVNDADNIANAPDGPDRGSVRPSKGIRINKCFKDFTSRREADRLVRDGRVTVNDIVAGMGDMVLPGDVVALDGRPVRWERLAIVDDSKEATAQFRYIKYWKPRGVVCTTDRRTRGNIIDAVGYPERVFPVGRLDKDSTGLILLTSDGRLPNAVLRSGRRKNKTYVVKVDREVRLEDVRTLREGVMISTPVQRDRVERIITARTLPCRVEKVGRRAVEIVLQEGRNRQIRRMLDAVGYEVKALHRVEVQGIGLSGLRPGEWKHCSAAEMDIIAACLDDPAQGDSDDWGYE